MSSMSLEKAFNFNEEELRLNRAGRMSKAQRQRIVRSGWLPFIILIVPVFACGVLTLMGTRNAANVSISLPIFLFLTVLFLIWLGRIGQQQRMRNPEVVSVQMVFGRIKFEADKRKLLFLDIGGMTFRLFDWQQAAFDESKMYRVYYLKHGLQVLSAEIAVKGPDTPRKPRKFPTSVPQL